MRKECMNMFRRRYHKLLHQSGFFWGVFGFRFLSCPRERQYNQSRPVLSSNFFYFCPALALHLDLDYRHDNRITLTPREIFHSSGPDISANTYRASSAAAFLRVRIHVV